MVGTPYGAIHIAFATMGRERHSLAALRQNAPNAAAWKFPCKHSDAQEMSN
jgi:hypothetical protein